jgi:hypothetical protein
MTTTGAGQVSPSEPTPEEVDFKHLLDVLDVALSSDNPAVRDQLQKLLMIATLVSTENPSKRMNGPLSQIFEEITILRNRVGRMEQTIEQFRGRRETETERMKREISGYPSAVSGYPSVKWEMSANFLDEDYIKKLWKK